MKPRVLDHSALSDGSGLHPVWNEWGRLTRFLESARLAFVRESNLWTSLELRAADEVKLSAATPHGIYKVGLQQHLDAVRDEEMRFASVLIHSYALAEASAAERLGRDARDFGGIEGLGYETAGHLRVGVGLTRRRSRGCRAFRGRLRALMSLGAVGRR